MVRTATEYILAMTIEIERRKIQGDASQLKRALELSAYFTKPLLEGPHRQIALIAAMQQAFKHKNFLSASNFASRSLASGCPAKHVETVSFLSFSLSHCLPKLVQEDPSEWRAPTA